MASKKQDRPYDQDSSGRTRAAQGHRGVYDQATEPPRATLGAGRRPYDQAREARPAAPGFYDQAAEGRRSAPPGAGPLSGATSPHGAAPPTRGAARAHRGMYDQAAPSAAARRAAPQAPPARRAVQGQAEGRPARRAAPERTDEAPARRAAPKQGEGRSARRPPRGQPDGPPPHGPSAGAHTQGQAPGPRAHGQAPPAPTPHPQGRPAPPGEDLLPTPLQERGLARRRRAKRRRALVFSVLLLLAAGIWVLVAFVFKISDIQVTGGSIYDESVILDNFSCRPGDNLFAFNSTAAAAQLAAALPYLETVRITRMPPGTVTIEVTPSVEAYFFVGEGVGVITSPSLKVLRMGDNTGGLPEVRGAVFGDPAPGQPLAFAEQAQADAVGGLLAALRDSQLQNYTALEVGDIYNISLRCENRFVLQLGTSVGLDYKLRLSAEAIYNRLAADATGLLDASSAYTSRSVYYTPGRVDEEVPAVPEGEVPAEGDAAPEGDAPANDAAPAE